MSLKSPLSTLLSKLGIEETIFFLNKEDNSYGFDFHSDIKNKLSSILPDAIYIFNNQPLILFFDLSDNASRESDLHKKVWSFDNSPIIFIIKSSEISIYNALNYIKEGEEGKLEEIKISQTECEEKFSFWNLQSGETWNWLQEKYLEKNHQKQNRKRVNERLFQNIKEVRKYLTQLNQLNPLEDKEANSLILKLIFIRYLIDRGIKIDDNFISGENINDRRKNFSLLIRKPNILRELFKSLNNKFNGALFREYDIALSQGQSDYLADVFKGELQQDDSLFEGYFFEIFDFSIIPVEVISGIYESLIDEETRDLNSAVYTPPFLVDYILNDTVDKYLNINNTSECPIFEVAVGSGIFLVQSLRRMIEKEIEINGKNDTVAFSNRIREIAKRNLFGIDINGEALKVTCFSIYIALLDYQEPKDVEKYPFPNLLDENLFEANFFDIEHKFNTIIMSAFPKFILGNPPWKSKRDDEIHTNWIKSNKKVIGNFEIAQSFLLRTKDFMNYDTSAALIVTSTIFYNVSKPTIKFKKDFLTSFCVTKFFDLSPVRRLIFEQKNSPASVVYYKLSKEREYLKNIIIHQSIKSNRFLKFFKMIVIEKFDQKEILQRYFIENDWMFKVALYGNTLDFQLLLKLEENKSINEFFGKKIKKLDGFKRDKLSKFNIDDIDSFITEKSSIFTYYTPTKNQQLNENLSNIYSNFGKFRTILKGQTKNESEIVASFAEGNSIYRNDTFIITSDENTVKHLYSYFISNLYTYYQYITSSTWGIATRPAIRLYEYTNFPFVESEEVIKEQLIELVSLFIKPFKKYYNQEIRSETLPVDSKILFQINDIINNQYCISEYERDLIDYALNISRYQFQENKQSLFLKKIDNDTNFIEKYAEVYIQEFNKIYPQEFIMVEIYPLNHFVALNFVFKKNKPSKTYVYPNKNNEKEVLQVLANNLSISKVVDVKDSTKNLFIQKDIKGFEKDSFYIIKPNELKCWHRAMAWYDVAEFKKAIEEAELNNLNNIV